MAGYGCPWSRSDAVIRESGKLEKETEEKLKSALEAYTESFLDTRIQK